MRLTKKTAAIGICFLFAVLMAPIAATCFYTYPALDDYNFSAHTHLAFLNGQSVLWAALENARNFYMTWQGNYTYNFIAGIQPFVFYTELYCLSNLTVLLMVSGTMLLFFFMVLCRLLGAGKSEWLLFTLPLLLIFWELMPSISEGLYWMDGSLNICCFSLLFLLLSVFISFHMDERHKKWKIAAALLLSVCLGGSEQADVIAFLIACGGLLMNSDFRRSETAKLAYSSAAVMVIGLVISTAAPGNGTRMSLLAGSSFYSAIKRAVISGFAYFDIWMNNIRLGALLMGCVLMYPFLQKSKFEFRHPLAAAILCYGFYTCDMAVVYFAKGDIGAARQLNSYFLSFTYSTAVMALYLTGWLSKRYPKLHLKSGKHLSWEMLAAVTILVVSGICSSDMRRISTVDTAWGFYKGYTQHHAAQMQQRIRTMEESEAADVMLEPMDLYLNYFVPEPLKEDAQFWANQSMAAYYGKNSVQLIQEEEK